MNKFSLYSLVLLPVIAAFDVAPSYAAPIPQSVSMPAPPAMPVAAVTAEKIDAPAAEAADDDEETKADVKEETKKQTKKPAKAVASEEPAPVKETPVAAPVKHAAKILRPTRRPGDDEDLPVVDTDETLPLPPYPPKARTSIGALQTYAMGEEDTLQDVARYFKLGFVELRTANPKVDPWTPVPSEPVTIPAFHLLPRTRQVGIVVNLAQMRMYYFKTPGQEPITFPIGIGREGLLTPTGETTIVNKAVNPSWCPTPRMREEKPYLPAVVGPGPSNPLGSHALYLGWPEYRIHGTDKPWAIGRRVSSGCMRMYPEDIKALFNMVPVGTKVTVVEQPILVGWIDGELYLEANPSKAQSLEIEVNGDHQVKELTDGLRKVITDASGVSADRIDWDAAEEAIEQRLGYPVVISKGSEDKAKPAKTAPAAATQSHGHALFRGSTETKYKYNR